MISNSDDNADTDIGDELMMMDDDVSNWVFYVQSTIAVISEVDDDTDNDDD